MRDGVKERTIIKLRLQHLAIIAIYTVGRSQLIIADVAPMIFLSSGTMRRVGKEISFEESNVTLRELLDRIILKTDIKRWVLLRWGKNSEYITLRS